MYYNDWCICAYLFSITRLIGLYALYKLHTKHSPLLKILLKQAVFYTLYSITTLFYSMYTLYSECIYTCHNQWHFITLLLIMSFFKYFLRF